METIEKRYMNDPEFRALVDCLAKQIKNYNYTPSEVRGAGMLASIIVERTREPDITRMFNIAEDELNKPH